MGEKVYDSGKAYVKSSLKVKGYHGCQKESQG